MACSISCVVSCHRNSCARAGSPEQRRGNYIGLARRVSISSPLWLGHGLPLSADRADSAAGVALARGFRAIRDAVFYRLSSVHELLMAAQGALSKNVLTGLRFSSNVTMTSAGPFGLS